MSWRADRAGRADRARRYCLRAGGVIAVGSFAARDLSGPGRSPHVMQHCARDSASDEPLVFSPDGTILATPASHSTTATPTGQYGETVAGPTATSTTTIGCLWNVRTGHLLSSWRP